MATKYKIDFAIEQLLYGLELLDSSGATIDYAGGEEPRLKVFDDSGFESTGDIVFNGYKHNPIHAKSIEFYLDETPKQLRFKTDGVNDSQEPFSFDFNEINGNGDIASTIHFTGIKQQKELNLFQLREIDSGEASDRHVVAPVEPDDTRIAKIKSDIRLGRSVPLLDVITLQLGTTALAVTAINILVDGGGYDELTSNGISSTNAIKTLSIYNQQIDVKRIETEKGIALIKSDFSAYSDFNDFLSSLGKDKVSPGNIAKLYSDIVINSAVFDWYSSKVSVTV